MSIGVPVTLAEVEAICGRTALADRILAKSEPQPNGCWVWRGSVDRHGYGYVAFSRYRKTGAHKAAYLAFCGDVPGGLTVDHLCFNPPCVNPAHLRLLTNEQNATNQRSAFAVECVNGHPWVPENTYYEKRSKADQRERGRRRCKACLRERKAKARDRSSSMGPLEVAA